MFIAINEYLMKVPQNEPGYRKIDTDHLDHRILLKDDEIFIDDLLSSDEEEEEKDDSPDLKFTDS